LSRLACSFKKNQVFFEERRRRDNNEVIFEDNLRLSKNLWFFERLLCLSKKRKEKREKRTEGF
jgi:hypothetical protein